MLKVSKLAKTAVTELKIGVAALEHQAVQIELEALAEPWTRSINSTRQDEILNNSTESEPWLKLVKFRCKISLTRPQNLKAHWEHGMSKRRRRVDLVGGYNGVWPTKPISWN
ncbi:hypothetical protein ABVK25_005452 [Lepraria finkii]|uniref:Uncharacterized protein n=1 Tax=Lepraria finkii TaxID=1340010 RepID=A0ABR4B8X5_9LECA